MWSVRWYHSYAIIPAVIIYAKGSMPGFPALIIRIIVRFGKLFEMKKPLEEQFFSEALVFFRATIKDSS
jgi:hypothetical protein